MWWEIDMSRKQSQTPLAVFAQSPATHAPRKRLIPSHPTLHRSIAPRDFQSLSTPILSLCQTSRVGGPFHPHLQIM